MTHKFTALGGISVMRRLAGLRRSAQALLAPLSLIPLLCVSALGQTYNIHTLADGLRAGTARLTQTAGVTADSTSDSTSLTLAGSMAQIASAGGWDTSLTLVNLGTTSGEALLNFYANNGNTLPLPFTFPQQPSSGTTVEATLDQNINANATLVLDTTGPATQTAAVGAAQLLTRGDIGAFAIFKYTPSGQEAVVPLETRNASSYLLAFDNTGQISTGLAIANLARSAAKVGVIIRGDTGAQIGTGSISLAAQGHNSFLLTDSTYGFPVTAGVRGTVEFDTPSGGQISVLGLRANAIPNSSGFAVTTIPTLASVGTGGGTMAHIASGGGWQTTFTLVNTGTSAATANLDFYGDNGSAVSLPLSFPQSGAASTATKLSRSIAAGASLIVVVQDSGGATATTGSAVLTTNGNVGGFAVFRYNPTGQEAVVPLEVGDAPSYVLAFDNTGSLGTGLAIANVAAQAASASVVIRDDTGAQIGTGSISLPAQGHTSFMLTDANQGYPATAGIRGTITFVTPAGGQIAPLGLRATPAGALTTIPVMPIEAPGGVVAERALAQTGLSVALASNVLQSQIEVLLRSGTASSPCTALTGNGSIQSGSAPSTTVDGNSLYPVTVYYDSDCRESYIAAQITSASEVGQGDTLSETAIYYGLTGTKLGTMTLDETLAETNDNIQVHGLGLFKPAAAPQTPVQLGLACNVSVGDISGGSVSGSIPCVGAVAQDFPALNLAIGSVTGITLTPGTAAGSLAFTGSGSIFTGPIGSLTLTNPSPDSFAIPSGTAYASTTASGGAGAFALFPPTPTSWTLTDAAHDEQLQISVISDTTRNSSLTVTQVSTGATLATGAVDQSGTGIITYSDGSKAAITSWTLAD
jgi:hypothetical protein